MGNAISDFVKGRKQYDYPEPIFKGIRLHRAIDDLTDNHAATKEAKEFFRPTYRLYAGAFTDVVFDHFLANDSQYFPTENSLAVFAERTYQTLQQHYTNLPERFQKMLPYMQQQNWLLGYRFPEGIRQSLGGLVRRSAYLTDAAPAYQILQDNYASLRHCFELLFPDLVAMSLQFIASQAEDF